MRINIIFRDPFIIKKKLIMKEKSVFIKLIVIHFIG